MPCHCARCLPASLSRDPSANCGLIKDEDADTAAAAAASLIRSGPRLLRIMHSNNRRASEQIAKLSVSPFVS